jgi:cyclopropane-fatty-acyl-phospholipid synthase
MALGINNVAAISGTFIGLVLGGVLAPIDWRLVFFVSVPFGLFGTIWAYRVLVEQGERHPAPIDWASNLSFAVGLVLVMIGITYGIQPYRGHDMGWANPVVLGELIVGVAILAGFVMIESKVAEPMFRLALFRIRAFTAGTLSTFLAACARGGLMFVLIIWLQGIWLPQHGYSFANTPLWAGIYMLPLTAGILLAGPLSGILSDHLGSRSFTTGGMIGTGASFVLLWLLPVNFTYAAFAAVLFLAGLSMGAFASPNRAAVMNSLPGSDRGAGAGMIAALRPAGGRLRHRFTAVPATLRAAHRLGLIGRPPTPPAEEARPRGWRHSRRRDAHSISHHYDVGNEFYRLVLGDTMTYSCARFIQPTDHLDDAQAAKHELICRKLGLHEHPGMRLLDVGCGWGATAIHAARHHHARVMGITISREQADYAPTVVHNADLDHLVEIRLQDYRDLGQDHRDLGGERFDAISSIDMFEHVGRRRMADYFSTLRSLLTPQGRILNHAISSVGGSRLGRRSFTQRYVFPEGELVDVGDVALAMEAAGFEVRDVESLREHYALTLRHWVANLRAHWAEAVELVGEGRARVWLLYMAASAIGSEDGGLAVHQVLGVVPDQAGHAGMPPTRRDWK